MLCLFKFTNEVIDTGISFIALLVSVGTAIYTYLINKKRLEVDIESETFKIDYIVDENSFPLYKAKDGSQLDVIILKVVNPSPHDVGFFDLVIMENNDLQSNLIPIKKANIKSSGSDPFVYGSSNSELYSQLNLLEASYGVFPANSFIRFDLPILVPNNINYVTLRFKVAIPSRKKVPHSIYRKKYKYYKKEIKIG